MSKMCSFVWYQINDSFHFLSPETVFESVDLPYWQAVHDQGILQIDLCRMDTRNSIADYFFTREEEKIPFIKSQERMELTKPILQVRNQTEILHMFEGRHVLLSEVKKALLPLEHSSNGIFNHEYDLLETLQKLYLQGFFDWNSPIDYRAHSSSEPHYCRRCGCGEWNPQGNGISLNLNSLKNWLQKWKAMLKDERMIQVHCSICGSERCFYCPNCLQLGLAKSCDPLLTWRRLTPTAPTQVAFTWHGELSAAQEQASNELVQFVHKNKHDKDPDSGREFLIYAVCGSGKTEVIFQTIYHSLMKNQKVLITCPRRDVIVELAPRLKEAFPETRIAILHGESNEKYMNGELFLATTHQVVRFKQFFDLIIIDEEDAYPFHHDPMLPHVVKRARRLGGFTVYLTATPKKKMLQRVYNGDLEYVRIDSRFHGYPLAVPTVQPIGNWRKNLAKGVVITEIAQYIRHLMENQRYGYLFVPQVKDIERVKEYLLHTILPYVVSSSSPFTIESVHANDPRRTELVQRFRMHHIDLLITTTILERGVTISYCDVAVLGSDDPVYDAASLIQIAGRAGRKMEDPVGHVWFFPQARTKAQKECIRQIKESNHLVSKKGEHSVDSKVP